jgi:hypothetical protein
MNKQKTLDPEILSLNLFYKKDFYNKASNFLSAVSNYSTQLQTAVDYQKTLVSNDVITSQAEFFNKLNKDLDGYDAQFAAYWVRKYNSTLNQIKTELAIKGGNNKYFKVLSDSVGSIGRIENYYDDSTSLVSDVDSSNKVSPLRYGSSLFNKINPNSLMLHAEMSKKLNILFNKNINNIQPTIAENTTAHGDNLIPDIAHFQRIQSNISTINQKIQSSFGVVYKLIEHYCFYNPQNSTSNLQFAPNINITVDVEGHPINQDLLFNQLQQAKSNLTTMKVLGVEKQ